MIDAFSPTPPADPPRQNARRCLGAPENGFARRLAREAYDPRSRTQAGASRQRPRIRACRVCATCRSRCTVQARPTPRRSQNRAAAGLGRRLQLMQLSDGLGVGKTARRHASRLTAAGAKFGICHRAKRMQPDRSDGQEILICTYAVASVGFVRLSSGSKIRALVRQPSESAG